MSLFWTIAPKREHSQSAPWGFSIIEVLVALTFLMVALVGMFSIFSSSNRGSMDAYRETYARSLALEALEWVSGLGYEGLAAVNSVPNNPIAQRLGLGTFSPISSVLLDDGTSINYPEEYRQFERQIQLVHYPADRLFLIRVTVRGNARATFRRGSIVLEKLVGAEYD